VLSISRCKLVFSRKFLSSFILHSSYIHITRAFRCKYSIVNIWERSILCCKRKQVGEESDSSGSERSPKQAKRKNRGGAPPTTRRRKSGISARERNLRRLESNERERMRMHSLNDAFEVTILRFLIVLLFHRVDKCEKLE